MGLSQLQSGSILYTVPLPDLFSLPEQIDSRGRSSIGLTLVVKISTFALLGVGSPLFHCCWGRCLSFAEGRTGGECKNPARKKDCSESIASPGGEDGTR
ncbi:hypothetical protein SUGI_1223090 [Cryptomeria japonica]|uniref:Uncharacterized protein n=1 Tax=Cryptomeria japonica TaxID=3369 RepID=A0AAD3NRQ1_CRYJA|nr:hypothetical protein SUGI_1223090 [Cryptomeria japonica]